MERSTAVTASDGDTSERPGRTERKRRAILQEAEALFLDRGFVGASVEEVAARAAVSKQAAYKQFESKAALFVAVVQDMTGQASDRAQAGVRRRGSMPANRRPDMRASIGPSMMRWAR